MKNLIPYFIHQRFQRGEMSGRMQAASLFVDLSGFTPLTEALMQHQRDGAEVLNEALESIFSPLVTQVIRRGGIIPLYAGDAFAALFPHDPANSPDAPLQALCVADELRTYFAQDDNLGLLSTKYGDFRLGARVGVAYGEIRWGIVAYLGRHTYYFRGEAMRNCSLAQRAAGRGEVVAHRALLPWLKDPLVAEVLPQSEFVKVQGCPSDTPPPAIDYPSFTREALVPFAPNSVIDLLVKAEFRDICPVFISFQEPDDIDLLHHFAYQVMELGYRHGGKLAQIDFGDHGPLFLFYFGAPVAYENNVERAIEYLLALQQAVTPVRWRAGVTYGTVWAGIRGGRERCEYGAVGTAVNLACRLATSAQWDQIWVDQAVFERLSSTHRLETVGVFDFKGMPAAVNVYQPLGRRFVTQASSYGHLLVDRADELSQLVTFVEPIFAGRFAGVATVYGEAGMGKSHLVYELRRQLAAAAQAGARVAVKWFFCPADEILRQSLNPFRYFLRRYFRQSADQSPEANRESFDRTLNDLILAVDNGERLPELAKELERTRSFLGALVDLRWDDSLYEQLDPLLRFENSLRAFKSLVQAESLRQPVVIHVDDLHWLDADSYRMLQVLTNQMEGYPVALVCTSRFRDDGGRILLNVSSFVPQSWVDLPALGPAGIQAIAAQVLQSKTTQSCSPHICPVTPTTATFLAKKTGGNPFFVEQLALDLFERGLLEQQVDGGWQLISTSNGQVPSTINAVLMARLDRLMITVRQVVQAAAVLGREFQVQVLACMLQGELNQTLTWVRQAETEQVWRAVSDLRYIFRHALMRDAAYEMQLRSRLRKLHLLAASAIEEIYPPSIRGPLYGDLVFHAHYAGDLEREQRYARLAGEYAAGRYANQEAIDYFSRALELAAADHWQERYALLLAREAVFHLEGARQEQLEDLQMLEQLVDASADDGAEAVERRAEIALRQAKLAERTGDYVAAAADARKAIRLAQMIQNQAREANGHMWLGRILQRQGRFQAAQEQLQQALVLARQTQAPEIETHVLRHLGTIYLNHYADGPQARLFYQQSLEKCREVNDRLGEATALRRLGNVSLGHPFLEQSSYLDAIVHYRASLRVSQEIGYRDGEGGALNNLGETHHRLGNLVEAQACYQDALQLFRETENQLGRCITIGNLSRLAHDLEDEQMAVEHGRQALAAAEELGVPEFVGVSLVDLGLALEGLGQYQEALEAYRRAFTIRQKLGLSHLALEALAGLARIWLDNDDLAQALALVEQILEHENGRPSTGEEDYFRIHSSCYQVLRASGDPRATLVLEQACQMLQLQAAKLVDPQLRASFLQQVPIHRQLLDALYRA